MVLGTQSTSGVGPAGIAGKQECLTAASAPIDFFTIARAARVRHPGRAAIPRKGIAVVPRSADARFAHVGKAQGADRRGCRAGQHAAVRRDREGELSPPMHTRFRQFFKIVRQHVGHVDVAARAFAKRRNQPRAIFDLGARGHQRRPIGEGPAVKLHVRELEPSYALALGKGEHRRELMVIEFMQNAIER